MESPDGTRPKLSAIVPVHDNEDRVAFCLESIRAQSYGDFEAIVIDDGSTDESAQVAAEFCAEDARFHFEAREHGGVSAARNVGIERARGEYVAFIDADDLVPADAFKHMHQATVVYDADTVCGVYERIDGITPYRNARSYHLANKTRRIAPDDPDLVHSWSLCNKWLSLDVIREHGLRFEPLRHLEDAVFLYGYLQYARAIYACPHTVYTYRKPLPLEGRTTTQGATPELLSDANRALALLRGLTAGYGGRFEAELDYRFLNTPLLGDYYQRLWKTDDAFADTLAREVDAQLARLDAEHRERALAAHRDLLEPAGVRGKEDLLAHPLVAVVVEPGVTKRVLPALLEGLYDQAEASFEVLVAEGLRPAVPPALAAMPNLSFYRGGENEALAQSKARFVAVLDAEALYDHRSLSTMAKALSRDEALSCVRLPVSTLAGATAELSPGSLADRMFRADVLRATDGDLRAVASGLEPKLLKKPVVISLAGEGEVTVPLAGAANAASVDGTRKPEHAAPRGFLRRVKQALRSSRKHEKHSEKPSGHDSTPSSVSTYKKRRVPTREFYLNLDIDPDLVVVEALGKRPRGSSLYLLQELQKPAYGSPRIAFSVTEATRAFAERVMEERGFENVTCVLAGSDEYKRALFSARVLFNEVDFPNWWIKKPRQIYVNLWHGTPLKKLGRTKGGIVHRDANASRNFTMADYVLCPSEYAVEHILGDCDVLGLTHARALMLGYPRTGELFSASERELVRERCRLSGKQVIAWMPTYRDYLSAEVANAFLRQMDARLSDHQVLYVNLHHKTVAQVSCEGLAHVRPFPPELDTYEFLCGVDVLVTDYSSVMFDFAATGRRTVLYCPDRVEYAADRGLYLDLGELPFPVVEDVEGLVAALADGVGCPDDAFAREFNAYDSPENTARLCRLALLGDESGLDLRPCAPEGSRPIFLVSDGLPPGPATDLLYGLADQGAFEKGVYLSFLEREVEKNRGSAYPLVERVPLYATKGKPLSERTEQQRLYNDLNPRAVVVLETESARRVRCFARFDVPVYLFVQPAFLGAAREDAKALKALKLFAKWGNGLFAMDENVACEVRDLVGVPVEVIATPEAFARRFLPQNDRDER